MSHVLDYLPPDDPQSAYYHGRDNAPQEEAYMWDLINASTALGHIHGMSCWAAYAFARQVHAETVGKPILDLTVRELIALADKQSAFISRLSEAYLAGTQASKPPQDR